MEVWVLLVAQAVAAVQARLQRRRRSQQPQQQGQDLQQRQGQQQQPLRHRGRWSRLRRRFRSGLEKQCRGFQSS